MDRGTQNVLDRLTYRWKELYGEGPVPVEQLLKDWELAKGQGTKWLSQDIEDTIIRWAVPK